MARSDPNVERHPESAAARIRRKKHRIIEAWEERVRREIFAARRESHPIIVDTLPKLLDDLIETLADPAKRKLINDGATACEEHGGERARVTHWSVEDVVHEYQILREVIFVVLKEDGPISEEDEERIRHSLDEVMKSAATAFALVQKAIREQFVATLTHDLRGPLTAALTAAHLILKYSDRPDQHPRLASRIVQNLDRIERMITDLLDATRVRAGERLTLRLAECSMDEIAREVADEMSVAHGVEVRVEAPSASGFWDASALRRVLENLITNAIKYGDTSRPIDVRIVQEHERTLVSVHNDGAPIPVDEQETLFNAYRRASQSERNPQQGWGLGLALVRGVAEAHGGSVMLDSTEKRGTTFTVDIPSDARPFHTRAQQPFT